MATLHVQIFFYFLFEIMTRAIAVNRNGYKPISPFQCVDAQNENIFEILIEASKICSLGQITNALFDVGGEYRRNM